MLEGDDLELFLKGFGLWVLLGGWIDLVEGWIFEVESLSVGGLSSYWEALLFVLSE